MSNILKEVQCITTFSSLNRFGYLLVKFFNVSNTFAGRGKLKFDGQKAKRMLFKTRPLL